MDRYCKRLIEVDLPIRRISAHARREKSIRHGHISTLHIWWARRPLAACRAVICASLWPDPADELCPEVFCKVAREQMTRWAKDHLNLLSKESLARFVAISKDKRKLDKLVELRAALLDFIADFANWDNSTVPEYLETSRLLTQTAHVALGGELGSRPMVVDPFAGGGAIPLESLRVGAAAFASDLNGLAVVLNKVLLEYAPKHGDILADSLRKWGRWVGEQAFKRLSTFFPTDEDGAVPAAYLWARTIRCEGPGCGVIVPLVGSLWLSRKRQPRYGLKFAKLPDGRVGFEILSDPDIQEVPKGITAGNKAICPQCGFVTQKDSVKRQLAAKNGGSQDARLLAVVTTRASQTGKQFRLPTDRDLEAVEEATRNLSSLKDQILKNGMPVIPDEKCPPVGALGYRFQPYGIKKWSDLYTTRQLLVLSEITQILVGDDLDLKIRAELDDEATNAVKILLALTLSRLNDRCSTLCRWEPDYLKIQASNGGENKMPMRLDFVEQNPFSGMSGSWSGQYEWIAKVIEHVTVTGIPEGVGQAIESPAQSLPLPDDIAGAMVTDPPYYDAFGYSDLSEFFYVWLRRVMPESSQEFFTPSKPLKREEAIVIGKELEDGRGLKNTQSYLQTMTDAFDRCRAVVQPNGIGVTVFASKSTAAWEALLQSLVNAGWVITGSWAIDTEMAHRTRALGSASLQSSIHLICRPRENPDGSLRIDDIGDWRDVLAELPIRIHKWMPRLAENGVVGADAIFSCLGPALEIYSRYSAVEKSTGKKVLLKDYLEEVWAAIAREALSMIFEGADASGFEEDARLTAMWLWTLRSRANGDGEPDSEEGQIKSLRGYRLEFDAARKIAQGLGAHLENLGHLVEVKGDTATLLSAGARTKYLFGKDATEMPRGRRKKKQQLSLDFVQEIEELDQQTGDWASDFSGRPGATVLGQLHQAMILFGAGRSEAMRRFLVEDGVGRNPPFWRLAQALLALYPTGSDEKRWVEGVMARKKGLGL